MPEIYQKIKQEYLSKDKSEKTAKSIAAATTETYGSAKDKAMLEHDAQAARKKPKSS
ncbi:MAG TPA: hypothetical protein VN476_14955 [Pyrinomonadaceae bacterium]|nr:hypothetical protein [Pyrinomonadaceae bacterium]